MLGRHLRRRLRRGTRSRRCSRRCVFVGNLDFVDDDKSVREEEAQRRAKGRQGGQGQERGRRRTWREGLWRELAKAGKGGGACARGQGCGKTRVGKGFAYVQFTVRLYLFKYDDADVSRTKTPSRRRCCSTGRSSRPCCLAVCASCAQRSPRSASRSGGKAIRGPRWTGRCRGRASGAAGVARARRRFARSGEAETQDVEEPQQGGRGGGRLRGASCQGQRSRRMGLKVGRKKRKGKPSTRSTKLRRRLAQDGAKPSRSLVTWNSAYGSQSTSTAQYRRCAGSS